MSLLKQKHYATRVFGGCLALAISMSTVGVTAHAEEIGTENTASAVADVQADALEDAQQAVAQAQAEAEAKRLAAEEEAARAKAEAEKRAEEIKAEAERRKAEEEARIKAEEDARKQEEARKQAEEEAKKQQEAFESALSSSGMSDADFNALCKIVQAEAGHEPTDGKVMVANVVLNRVRSPFFANSISAVIASPGQFGPVSNGRFAAAVPSADTVNAVKTAIAGTDLSNGALYFHRGSSWGNKTLIKTVGSHSFFA